ncbi:MAG TPA: hypothetical protein VHZ25_04630 [Acidobacteriaceae bacterium]|jgi:hypothetical protein|nr:hypothetical protein [Acidobacteriaceae bacterium]
MLGTVTKKALCALTFLGAASAIAQQASAPAQNQPPRRETTPQIQFAQTLDVFTTTPLAVAPFGFIEPAQCDDSGRMFFASLPSLIPKSENIVYTSLSADGQQQVLFRLPPEIQKEAHNTDFYAASNGELHLVVVQPGIRVLWFRFDTAGKLEGEEDLPVPPDILVRSFAVTRQGFLLLLAYHPASPAHDASEGKTYRAIFNPVGRLVTELAAADAGLGKDGIELHPSEDLVRADDETFYMTDGRSLAAMDSTGNLIQTIEIDKPDPKELVIGLSISGGLAEITLLHAPPHQCTQVSFLVLGAAEGESRGLYLPPEGVPGSPICFDSKQGFTFFQAGKGHMRLVRALLP